MKVFKKLSSSFSKRKNILLGNGFSVEKSYGCKWLIDWSNTVDKKVPYKLFEDDQINYFINKIKIYKPEYFLDIGAHGGLYSIILQKNFSGLKVHAFEPDLQNRYQFYSNLFLNNFEKSVRVYDFGLSSVNKKVSFGILNKSNRGGKRIMENGDYEIIVKPLDEIFKKRRKNCFIKIDVEGHEKNVIIGSQNFLKNNSCLLQVEVSKNEELEEFDNLMKGLGYTLVNKIQDYYYSNFIKN